MFKPKTLMKTLKNFSKSVLSGKNKIVLAVFLIVLIGMVLFISANGLSLVSVGYTQGSQGLSFAFASVQTPSGAMITQSSGLNYQLNSGYPTIGGAMQGFTADLANASGLDKTYTWSIPNGTVTQNGQTLNAYTNYEMERVLCNMSFNIRLSGTGSQAGPALQTGAGAIFGVGGYILSSGVAPDYQNYKIWISITPNNFLYFKNNPSQLFIAPAYIGLNNGGAVIAPITSANSGSYGSGAPAITTAMFSSVVATYPQAQGDVFPIYYNLGGTAASTTQNTLLSYQGQTLDSSIFRSVYYIELTLSQFQAVNTYGWGGLTGHNWAFPSLQYNLCVYVYVIGSWTTYFKQGELPKSLPEPVVSGGATTVLGELASAISSVLSNPLYDLIILGIIIIIVAGILIFFFPEAVKIINSGLGVAHKGASRAGKALKSKTRKRGKKSRKKG